MMMAEAVVDLFEAIQIHHQEGHSVVASMRRCQCVLQSVL